MNYRRIVSALLCAVLLSVSLALPARAAEGPCDCGGAVQVFLDGFGTALYENEGTDEQIQHNIVHTDAWEIIKGLFTKGLGGLLDALMGHLTMNPDGSSVLPLTRSWHIPKGEDHAAHTYDFYYDYRIDPFEAAAQFKAFAVALSEETGHDKLAVTAFSEGSVVLMTYLKENGPAHIDNLVFVDGAWQGLTLVGELFTQRLGLFGLPIPKALTNRIYQNHLIPLFYHMPAVWAFVPDKYYEEARKMLPADASYDKLKASIDDYHYNVQCKAKEILDNAQAQGMKFAVVAGYGKMSIPVAHKWTYASDGLIDTALQSGGADCAPFGCKIDPSTAMYPDQTWFIKGSDHKAGHSHGLRQWMFSQKSQVTVHDNTGFPQFLRVEENGTVPLEG